MADTTTPTTIDADLMFTDVEVQLTGCDGNAFAILGACRQAIRDEHGEAAASRWENEAMQAESYDAPLRFCMSTLDVS